jgi:colicin import membrane protein
MIFMPEEDNKESKVEVQPSSLSEAQAEAAAAHAEYEAAKEAAEQAKPDDGTLRPITISDAVAASEAAAEAEVAYKAAEGKLKAARVASETAWKAEYESAKELVVEVKTGDSFSNKRKQDRIFRREMGEPEFFLFDKRVTMKSVLSSEEQEEISRKVQIPTDQTPKYDPKHVLSPEFAGDSNYEAGISDLLDEAKQKLDRLLNDPEANPQEIELTKNSLKKLEYLLENFELGMNVFRTAKGGRSTLRE